MEELELYTALFIAFFKIGLFGFGGGYAMLSLVQHEVVEVHQWINISDFTDMVAISQATPGPISFNLATYVGYVATGSAWGAAICTLAVALPGLIIMTCICRFFFRFKHNPYVASVIRALKITTIGLIGAAALLLINKHNFTDYASIILFLIAFVATFKFKLNPILLIVVAGIAGYFIY